MTDYCQVTTTLPTEEAAARVARALVEARLAACVQIQGPITSVYRWQGAVETSAEWYCHAKTTRARIAEVERVVRESHPYEVPEIIALPIVAGHAPYLRWIDESVDAGG